MQSATAAFFLFTGLDFFGAFGIFYLQGIKI
jgi:hypothetical protein